MSLIVFTPDADPRKKPGAVFHGLLEHLRDSWPGTFVLAGCVEPPAGLEPSRVHDWLRLAAPGENWAAGLNPALLEIVGRSFEARAAIFVGMDAEWLAEECDTARVGERLLLLAPGERILGASSGGLEVMQVGADEAAWLARLDDWLSARVPMEVFCAPGDGDKVRAQLERHAARERARRVVVHWRGIADSRLAEVIETISNTVEAPIEVELLLSEMIDIPRDWLTPSPVDFIKHPRAWWHLGHFVRLAVKTPGGVGFTVNTDSRRRWVHAGVGAMNAITGLIRFPRSLGGGRGRK